MGEARAVRRAAQRRNDEVTRTCYSQHESAYMEVRVRNGDHQCWGCPSDIGVLSCPSRGSDGEAGVMSEGAENDDA
jgi:hypothetical protein